MECIPENKIIEYPIKKFDNLNRVIYIDWNGVERCINVFWGDTNKIKIKYRLWHSETEVEAYDEKGNVIFQSSAGVIVIKFPRLKIKDGKLLYTVERKKIKEWLKKLDCNKN
nr:hypothetical protein [uncultured archaeon]